MAKRHAWLSVALLTAACAEDVMAPGACPDYCPAINIQVLDSIIPGSIERDSSYRGYVDPHEAIRMEVSRGGVAESRVVMRFFPFPEEINSDSIVAIDSFQISLLLQKRSADVSDLELAIFRLPPGVDTATTFQELDPFFQDSTKLGTLVVPDSVTGGTISAVFPGALLANLTADSMVAAIGVAFGPALTGFAHLAAVDFVDSATTLARFAQVDTASGELAEASDSVRVEMDTYVFSEVPPPDPTVLAVGGAPAARVLMRTVLPADIVDSAHVVRATLLLLPAGPALGAPGDTVFVRVQPLATDVGPKSPFLNALEDTLALGKADIPVGALEPVRIEVTHIVAQWRDNPDLPRTFILMTQFEGQSLAEFRFHSSEGIESPIMQVTYVPPAFTGVR
jgi:hypothetical protein